MYMFVVFEINQSIMVVRETVVGGELEEPTKVI